MKYLLTIFRTRILFIFFIATTMLLSCNNMPRRETAESLFLFTEKTAYYYDLRNPDEKHFLPYVLSEVSGLTLTRDGKILTIEDEVGKVFVYNLQKRDIDYGITFGKSGDYEGVEIVGDQVYVLESDGDLYNFRMTSKKKVDAKKIETPLSRNNDTEGLGYDPVKNQLLIACKEKGGLKDKDVKGKAIYGYDLDTDDFKKEPKLVISRKALKEFFEESNQDFQYDEKRIKFEPSAIAWHPIHERFYVLASVGKLLVVLDRDGAIEATYPISPSILGQPEGICFDTEGNMYISSEGEGDRGYILKYPMLRN